MSLFLFKISQNYTPTFKHVCICALNNAALPFVRSQTSFDTQQRLPVECLSSFTIKHETCFGQKAIFLLAGWRIKLSFHLRIWFLTWKKKHLSNRPSSYSRLIGYGVQRWGLTALRLAGTAEGGVGHAVCYYSTVTWRRTKGQAEEWVNTQAVLQFRVINKSLLQVCEGSQSSRLS